MRKAIAYIILLVLSSASILSWSHKIEAEHDICHEDIAHVCVDDHHACLLCEEYMSVADEPLSLEWTSECISYATFQETLNNEVLSRFLVRTSDRGPPLA